MAPENGGYGPLIPIAEADSGMVLLHLPEGFEYRVLSRIGAPMSDGFPTPPRSDGMAAFGHKGKTRLIRNHEVTFQAPHIGPAATAYDKNSGGGTTTLEVNRDRTGGQLGEPQRHELQLCRRDDAVELLDHVRGDDERPDADKTFTGVTINLEQKHGYLFEVPVSRDAGELVKGEPIRAAGRFAHEAAAVDPASGTVYMTEDDFAYASGFWRYLPPNNPFKDKRLKDGGQLQVLRVKGKPNCDTTRNQTVGVALPVEWVDIENPGPDAPAGDRERPGGPLGLRARGRAAGRGEVQPARGDRLPQPAALHRLDAGRRTAVRGSPTDRRLRRRLGSAVDVRHPLRDADARVREPVPGGARHAGQHHDLAAAEVRPALRGQLGRELPRAA